MMRYWQEPNTPDPTRTAPAVVDVLFTVTGRSLPVDHSAALAHAVLARAPWLRNEPRAGIHQIYVAASQNGWERPPADGSQPLMLSRRTKLIIRVPNTAMTMLQSALEQHTLRIADLPLQIGIGKIRPLSTETTLFARAIVDETGSAVTDELPFLDWAMTTLAQRDIHVRKALCGKCTTIKLLNGTSLICRSLLLAELSRDDALQLQHCGIGTQQLLGCGLFIPHKGIESVAPVAAT